MNNNYDYVCKNSDMFPSTYIQDDEEDEDIIAQQAALAQAKFGGLKMKSPMLHDEVSVREQ